MPREAEANFAEAVHVLRQEIATALARERVGRLAECPSTAETIDAMRRQTPLLWTRRREHERILTVRLGVGTQPSRHTVELPNRSRTQARHWLQLQSLQVDAALVQGVPVVADLRDCGSIGVAGPRAAAVGVARGVVTQLVALHSPADLSSVGIRLRGHHRRLGLAQVVAAQPVAVLADRRSAPGQRGRRRAAAGVRARGADHAARRADRVGGPPAVSGRCRVVEDGVARSSGPGWSGWPRPARRSASTWCGWPAAGAAAGRVPDLPGRVDAAFRGTRDRRFRHAPEPGSRRWSARPSTPPPPWLRPGRWRRSATPGCAWRTTRTCRGRSPS